MITPGDKSQTFSIPNTVTSRLDSPGSLMAVMRKLSYNAVGTQWTVETSALASAGSSFEAATCLRRLEKLLVGVDQKDRIRFCKSDFAFSVVTLRNKQNIWNGELSAAIVTMLLQYFNENIFLSLPTDVIIEIFLWIPIGDFCPITCVCKEWLQLGTSNAVWKHFYQYRFLRNNPKSLRPVTDGYMCEFKSRLLNPHVGDKVEVAWKGKFRLEAQEVYQGLAWWVAEVVEAKPEENKYKIRYPGWDSRWDEWVPRTRLRWAVEINVVRGIETNDAVEIWCCGATVPGAWLESRVKMIRGNLYSVGRVVSTGELWVERDRLRPIKSSSHFYVNHERDVDVAINQTENEIPHTVGADERSFFWRRFGLTRSSGTLRHRVCSIM